MLKNISQMFEYWMKFDDHRIVDPSSGSPSSTGKHLAGIGGNENEHFCQSRRSLCRTKTS